MFFLQVPAPWQQWLCLKISLGQIWRYVSPCSFILSRIFPVVCRTFPNCPCCQSLCGPVISWNAFWHRHGVCWEDRLLGEGLTLEQPRRALFGLEGPALLASLPLGCGGVFLAINAAVMSNVFLYTKLCVMVSQNDRFVAVSLRIVSVCFCVSCRLGLKMGAVVKGPTYCSASASGGRRWGRGRACSGLLSECDGSSVSDARINTVFCSAFFGAEGGWYLWMIFHPRLL